MAMASTAGGASRGMTREEKKVIFASSLGTVFEWYDFYLYGSLAAFIGATFFASYPEATRNIFALLAFAAGFLVRPFGALVFGRIGDLVGRKYTFLVTILIMGLSTFLVGLLPGSATWGIAAPVILIALRMLQGLALGGEYGGAATYVAEHAPDDQRGFYTSWIQTTATLGLFLSLIVILIVQGSMTKEDVRGLGLAHSVPAFLHPARHFGLDSAFAQRIADLQAHEGRGQGLESAAVGSFRPVEERQDRHPGAARPHRRPGRGVVFGPVLRAVLPAERAQGRRSRRSTS